MKNWLDIAQYYWKTCVHENDILIDATCGNGNDTLFLARLKPRILYSIDIQPEALLRAQNLLSQHLTPQDSSCVTFIKGSHAVFPAEIQLRSVKLIVYNLGYLPKGNKSITTLVETTIQSLKAGLELIAPEGAISLTCYPGHLEGKREEEKILSFTRELDPWKWSCCYHQWINRRNAPSLLLIKKSSE